MGESWLITGGAGFIGSNFLRMALDRTDAQLVVLDALTYAGNIENIADILTSPRIKFIKGNICDHALVTSIFSDYGIEKVIHFAAESHVDRSILGPKIFIQTNIDGTFTLLEAARAAWKRNEGLFLQIGTDEVFGALEPNDRPFNEESPYKPSSPYSASKASADHLVRAWHHTFGLPTIVSNCSNNYGPWQYPEKMIPLMILNALEGKELPVYGDGLQVRDWIHVEDHCDALLTVLEKGKPGETYAIGGNCEKANIDVVRAICDAVDSQLKRPKQTSRGLIRYVNDRPGHDRRYAVDNFKARAELGWWPMRDFEMSLADLVQWYVERKAWANAIRAKRI